MVESKQSSERISSSTSIRLAIGFGIVLCVFGAALLANLYYLRELRKASEEVRIRQQIRREALKVGRVCEVGCRELLVDGRLGADTGEQIENAYGHMFHTIRALATHNMSAAEWHYLKRLVETTGRLRAVFREARRLADGPEGANTRRQISELQATSSELLKRMTGLNTRIGQHFDFKTYRLEKDAQWFGELSQDIGLGIFGIALAASLLVVYLTHRAIVRPIRKLVNGTKTLASGDLTSRIEVPAGGEFRTLAESFNRMAEALETNQRQLVEAEKMATIGRFAAGIAHEINNPIAVILGYVKPTLARLSPHSPHREALKAIEEEARQCKNIVQGLLDLARPAAASKSELVSPQELVSEVINMARVLRLTPNIEVHTSVTGKPVCLPLSRSRLRQVIFNIVSNALEALQENNGGELSIEGNLCDGPQGADRQPLRPSETGRRFLVLRFTDNGPGIPQEHIEHLFEPFFTTRPSGTGLGLAVTYSIVEAHGGHLEVASTEGQGTTFVLSLPVQAAVEPQAAA